MKTTTRIITGVGLGLFIFGFFISLFSFREPIQNKYTNIVSKDTNVIVDKYHYMPYSEYIYPKIFNEQENTFTWSDTPIIEHHPGRYFLTIENTNLGFSDNTISIEVSEELWNNTIID